MTDLLTLTHEARIVRCKSCHAPIIWFATTAGKAIPIDASSVKPEDQAYEWGRHIAHFATCDDPNRWRKPR